MCDNENHNHEHGEFTNDPTEFVMGMPEEMRNKFLAGAALALLGSLCDTFLDSDYSDPTIYNALELAEKLSKIYGNEGLTDQIAITRMRAGNTIDNLIAEKYATGEIDKDDLLHFQEMGFGRG